MMWSTVFLFMTVLDIVKGLNTGYYDKRVLIDDRRKVVRHYYSNCLLYDILSLLSVMINRAYFPNLNYKVTYAINLLIFSKFYLIYDILMRIDTIFEI